MTRRRSVGRELRIAVTVTLIVIALPRVFTASPVGEARAEQAASGAAGAPHADLVLDVPVHPFAAAQGRSMRRSIDLTRSEGGVRLRAQGAGEAEYDLAFEGCAGSDLDIVLQVAGNANCSVRASRQRAAATASLSSTIDATGAITLTQAGFTPGSMEIDVRNLIVPTSSTFASRLAPVRWLGGRLVDRVVDARLPSLTRQTEREMQREIAAQLAAGTRTAVRRANLATDSLTTALSRDFGMMVRFNGATVAERTRLHFRVHDGPAPAIGGAVAPPSTGGDDLHFMVQIADTLPNVLGRRLRGVALVETDFRDLCLEPLGLVPEFDDDVAFGGPPAVVHFSDDDPLAVVVGPMALSFDVRLAGFTDCEGRRFETPCRIAAD